MAFPKHDEWRVEHGERIVDAIVEAIRMRSKEAPGVTDRDHSPLYREAMVSLSHAIEDVARDFVEQREIAASYDG